MHFNKRYPSEQSLPPPIFLSVYNILFLYVLFFFPTKINYATINIPYAVSIYKDEGGYCDSGIWQALTKVILDLLYLIN